MKKYCLRRNFTASFLDQEQLIRGKIAFKTVEDCWLNTESSVIVLVSVHSRFHEAFSGDFKMNALISTIKAHVKGEITILLAEGAHLRAASLDFGNDIEKAFVFCLSSAESLGHRYRHYFEGCKVVFWHEYICKDEGFSLALDEVGGLYREDLHFRDLVHQDVEASYTQIRKGFDDMDKQFFIENCIEDLIEQCASLLILAKKGYRFLFYPGSPNACSEYACKLLIPSEDQISWMNVFLSIEKKVKILDNLPSL